MAAGRYEAVEVTCSCRDASGRPWQVTTRQGDLGSGQGFHFQVEPGKVTRGKKVSGTFSHAGFLLACGERHV